MLFKPVNWMARKLKIEAIQNDGLQEFVTIINQGTIGQPMTGWVLASLRGQAFYLFPDDLILRPAWLIVIHSGQEEPEKCTTRPGHSGRFVVVNPTGLE